MPDTSIRHLAEEPASESDRGASAVEQALLAALIAAVVVGSVIALGVRVDDLFGVNLTPDP